MSLSECDLVAKRLIANTTEKTDTDHVLVVSHHMVADSHLLQYPKLLTESYTAEVVCKVPSGRRGLRGARIRLLGMV